MSTGFRSVIIVLCFFIVTIIVFQSCDTFEQDSIEENISKDNENEFYTLPNSAVVIDLGAKVNSYEQVTISISDDPIHGKLSKLGGTLFKYEPLADFSRGKDHFKVNMFHNGKVFRSDSIHVVIGTDTTGFPCRLYAIEDKAVTKINTSKSVSFLANDRLCGIKKRNLRKEIVQAPGNGKALVVNEIIQYTPNSGFQGKDTLVYKISSEGQESLGLIRIEVVEKDTCTISLADDLFTFDVSTPHGNSFEFSIINNDRLCDVDSLSNEAITITGFNYGVLTRLGFGKFRYTLIPDLSRDSITFRYSICANGICDEANVTLRFTYTNCQLQIIDDMVNVYDSALTSANVVILPILNNDVLCGGSFSLSIIDPPQHGIATVQANKLTYKRESPGVKSDSLQYRICKTPAQCGKANVRIVFH